MTCGQASREMRRLAREKASLDGVSSCWDLADEMCQFSSASWSLQVETSVRLLCWGRLGPLPCLKRAASGYTKPLQSLASISQSQTSNWLITD